ncbi:MAG: FKBP-type peptidyl-prolyl cis-trans isomerase [Calditrichaeota bacterium]|nr:FKBP-type peptidyl-prolyl cis-trans isomerase [Calditrichota bacterium]
MRIFKIFLLFSLFLLITFCSKNKENSVFEKDVIKEGKNITIPSEVTTTSSGLKYIDLVEGSGPAPQAGQTVVVHYTGWLMNGKKFDSSVDRNQPFRFIIGQGQVIPGWEEGLQTMHTGGKRRLFIPYQLAYGERGYPPVIPPKAMLVFDVELLEIQ